MAVKLNAPTAELVRINVDEHPLFKRIWDDKTITRITDANAETVTKAQGLSALCIVDDPVMYKETLDMAVIGPELFNLSAALSRRRALPIRPSGAASPTRSASAGCRRLRSFASAK